MKKLALSLALAGIVGATSAVAESEGFFVGGSLANRSIKAEIESNTLYSYGVSGTFSAIKLGIVGGYNQNFTPELGLRYYAHADFLDDTINLNANVDALYSFFKNDQMEVRGFAGLFAGLASHDWVSESISGFDLGLNLGARFVLLEKHGIELFGKFGFLSQDKDYSYANTVGKYTYKISQPYQIGVRYTFSF